MATATNENGGEQVSQAPILAIGGALPPSAIDSKYLKVCRNDKVFHADLPATLTDMKTPEWFDAGFLKKTFTKPPTGRQKNPQQTPYSFPYCLLVFGPAATDARERLIVINYWLNRTKEEQKQAYGRLKLQFRTPSKSAELINKYDVANPQAITIGDSVELRKRRVEKSHSYKLAYGGNA